MDGQKSSALTIFEGIEVASTVKSYEIASFLWVEIDLSVYWPVS